MSAIPVPRCFDPEQAARRERTPATLGWWHWDAVGCRVFFGGPLFDAWTVEGCGSAARYDLAWAPVVHEEDEARFREAWAAAAAGETTLLYCETRVRTTEGWRWARLTGQVVERGVTGLPVRVLGTLEDVHDRLVHDMEREGRLAAIDASQLVVEFDSDGRVLHANGNFLCAMGYRLDELAGRHHSVLLQPQDATSRTYREFWDRLKRGLHASGLYRARGRGGREVWLQATFNPIAGPDGRTRKYVAYASDVTEQQQRHADLEGQVAAIHRSQMTMEFELDGTIRTANARALEVLGYSLDDLWGRHHRMLVPEAMRCSEEYAAFWASLSRGDYVSGCFQRLSRDGRDLWIQATYSPIFDSDGRPWKIVKYATDVTAETCQRAIFEGQIAAIARTQATAEFDLEGNLLAANEHFLSLTGYTLDELKGRHQSLLAQNRDASSGVYDELWSALRRGEHRRGDFLHRRKDGASLWITAAFHPILDPAGRPLRVLQYATDATVRVENEAALRASELKFRALFELSPVGMALIEPSKAKVVDGNDSLTQLLGGPHFEQSIREIASRAEEALQAPGTARRTGRRFGPLELELKSGTGEPVPVAVSGLEVGTGGARRLWVIVQNLAEQKSIQQELQQAALTDALTGLPNRAAFMGALDAAIARRTNDADHHFGLLFIDFDRFKFVNDTMGHAAGDELLRQIAARLSASVRVDSPEGAVRPGGLTARFGGDEFAVLVDGIAGADDAFAVADRLLAVLAEPYVVCERPVHSTASIGVLTSFQGDRSADQLLQAADVAMYEAKSHGRDRWMGFDDGMQERLSRRLCIENALRDAVSGGAIRVAFQPIVRLETGELTGVEALVRWTDPVLGDVSPAEFVPIAEESSLIVTLGARVLRESCERFVEWRRLDPDRAPPKVSVNLSRAELALGERYVELVRRVLDETGMPAHALQLEITEREVVRDPTVSRRLLHDLKSLGVRLAMDDFGTGASSLSCLRDYPFDVIKIDQSFLRDVESHRDVLMVLHATVTLIENLGMCSVAEGVERASQVAVLQAIGCPEAQGYLFGRAVEGERMPEAQRPAALAAGQLVDLASLDAFWSDAAKSASSNDARKRTNVLPMPERQALAYVGA
jgi:diguanylate cyclase (GGDEF)-like protein/PAS domain S-box-containing protein